MMSTASHYDWKRFWCPRGRPYSLSDGGYRARYVKEVDQAETTLRFYQEIYDEHEQKVEIHEKYPEDTGHRPVKEDT